MGAGDAHRPAQSSGAPGRIGQSHQRLEGANQDRGRVVGVNHRTWRDDDLQRLETTFVERNLVVNKATVEEKIGREWDPQEIHVSLISLSGNVVEEDDSFAVVRNN